MADDSWPSQAHNNRAVTDAEYEQLAAPASPDGVVGDPTQAAVVTAATGLNISIQAGAVALVRGHAWTAGGTSLTLPVAANTSGKTRMDWVVLRLDRSDWTVRVAIRQGTPGSGLPALVQAPGPTGVYEVPLAQLTIGNNAGAVGVARAELYAGNAVRPALAARPNPLPRIGDQEHIADTGQGRVWTGSGWQTTYGRAMGVTCNQPTGGLVRIDADSVLDYVNGTVCLRLGSFTLLTGSISPAVDLRLPVLIPAQYRHPSRSVPGSAYLSGSRIGRVTVYAANDADRPGQVWLTSHPTISAGDQILPDALTWTV
ncbi:hypothetical protein [Streptomyces sp. SPB074]|uniref:hypothetical protein n=1 Tax=Streptomyces sp. (strain SPB074) TaxID=465543 RepID=UPI00017F1007|nr:hypothetical protein [Streptomyces sp. SPB074]EDY42497.1 translation initiation factor IF-2 [Streptomyces sp. SPB074]